MEVTKSRQINTLNENEHFLRMLDRGIDDMEAGRLHTVDDAFQIIRDRMKNEL